MESEKHQKRLQKILAEAGLFSRRDAEKAILDGKIQVNGKTVKELGFKADPRKDLITLNGKRIITESKVYIMLNKPAGVLCTTRDDRGRTTVIDLIKHIPERVFPVGRLDYNTTGLLLLTNDGEFAQKMMRPSSKVPKIYRAKVRGLVSEGAVSRMLSGITVEGIKYRFADVSIERKTEKNSVLRITLTEGKNLQIKKLCQALGHPVVKLARIAYGNLKLGFLQLEDYRHLSEKEVKSLMTSSYPGYTRKKEATEKSATGKPKPKKTRNRPQKRRHRPE